MSPIAATESELSDAAIKAAWNDPSTSSEVSFERYFGTHRVRAIITDGPIIDDLILLARTGEEANFDDIWFIDGLDEPVKKTDFSALLSAIEWDGDRQVVTIRSDDIDFTYYPERIGEVLCYSEGIVPKELRNYGVPRDGRDD